MSFFWRYLIKKAHSPIDESVLPELNVKAHDIKGVATSLNIVHNLYMDKVMEATCWKTIQSLPPIILNDVHVVFENCRALGPVVAAAYAAIG